MIVDKVWKLTNTVSEVINPVIHTHTDDPLSRIMCDPIVPPVTVCHTGKRGRTVSDDAGGKFLSETSTSVRGQCVGESSTGGQTTD